MKKILKIVESSMNRLKRCLAQRESSELFKSFLEQQVNFQLNMISTLRLVIPTGQVFYLISAFISGFSTSSIIMTIVGFFSIMVIVYVTLRWNKKLQSYVPLLLSTLLLIWQLTTTEIIREVMKEMNLTPITNIYVGIFMGVTNSFITVSGVHWLYMVVYYLTYSIFWYLRMTPQDSRSESSYEQIIFSLLMFTGVIFLFRRKQLLEFNNYKKKMEFEENLNNFKNLIKEVLPEHIIIIDRSSIEKKSVLFLNDSARRRFRIRRQEEVFEILNRFRVEEVSSRRLNDINETCKSKNLKCVIDLISNIYFDEGEGNFRDFKTFQVRLGEVSYSTILDLSENDVGGSVFELKIGKTAWESSKDALILVLTDISNSHRLTKLKIQHQKKDQFLSTFTHEIRTPINTIIGMIQATLDLQGLKSEAKNLLDIGLCSAKGLILKVGDLLDLSAFNYGTIHLKIESLRVVELIEEVLNINLPAINQRGLQLFKEITVPGDTLINTDKLRFQQIFMNLITNAIKFTSKGFIKVTVREEKVILAARVKSKSIDLLIDSLGEISQEEEDLNEISIINIEVEDSGQGMDETALNHLFKLFEKFENVGKTTGVGLGLAVSQKLVSLLTKDKYSIEVKTKLGVGSTFSFKTIKEIRDASSHHKGAPSEIVFYKQRNFEQEMGPSLDSTKTPLTQKTLKDPYVLVVDDDPMNILVVTTYLKNLGGYKFETAGNGAEAIDKVRSAAGCGSFFDIILMDLNMPIMNGLEAAKEINEMITNKEIPVTKIVALTANNTSYNEQLCYKVGMHDFLSKPLYKEEFQRKMSFYLKTS